MVSLASNHPFEAWLFSYESRSFSLSIIMPHNVYICNPWRLGPWLCCCCLCYWKQVWDSSHHWGWGPQFSGFEFVYKTLVCILKAIYGLKQASQQWFDTLRTTLLKLGFSPTKVNPSLFVYHHASRTVYILVYVDDIIIKDYSIPLIHSVNQLAF